MTLFAAINYRHRRGGFTLLECLIVVSLGALLAVGTLRVLGDASMVRSNARDRLVLATIAQSELERLRALPVSELTDTTQTLTNAQWPEGVEVLVSTVPQEPGVWNIELIAMRKSIEGKPTVRLATLRREATP